MAGSVFHFSGSRHRQREEQQLRSRQNVLFWAGLSFYLVVAVINWLVKYHL